MNNKWIGVLLLTFCAILSFLPTLSSAQNTVTVNPSGGDAQILINNAVNSVASVATAGNPGLVILTIGTFKISGPIILKSNLILKGAGDSTIIFATNSVCNSEGSSAYIFGSGVSGIEICSMQFKSSAKGTDDGGHGNYRNCIQFRSCSNVSVHDILFTKYLYSDGVRVSKSRFITVYNCRMHSVGHDGVAFLSGSENCRMHNCDISVQTNTGCRNDGTTNCEVDHNTIYGNIGSGWCCLEVESSITNLNIHHNILHDFQGSSASIGVAAVHASGSVKVHDNVMWAVSPYIQIGIGTNILEPSDRNVANWVAKGYGCRIINTTPVAEATYVKK